MAGETFLRREHIDRVFVSTHDDTGVTLLILRKTRVEYSPCDCTTSARGCYYAHVGYMLLPPPVSHLLTHLPVHGKTSINKRSETTTCTSKVYSHVRRHKTASRPCPNFGSLLCSLFQATTRPCALSGEERGRGTWAEGWKALRRCTQG